MARTNIYLPDGLADEVAGFPELNVSAICQRALRKEVQAMKALEVQREEMGSIVVDVVDPKTWDVSQKRFVGRWLVQQGPNEGFRGWLHDVAITKQGQLAVWSRQTVDPDKGGLLRVFKDIEEMTSESSWPPPLVNDLQDALGQLDQSRIEDLDI